MTDLLDRVIERMGAMFAAYDIPMDDADEALFAEYDRARSDRVSAECKECGGTGKISLDELGEGPCPKCGWIDRVSPVEGAMGEDMPQPFAFFDRYERRFWEAADNCRDYLSAHPEVIELYTREQMNAATPAPEDRSAPVAWMTKHVPEQGEASRHVWLTFDDAKEYASAKMACVIEPLYAAPRPALCRLRMR